MTKIDADLLVLLSDVDGLYTSHPHDDGAEVRLRGRGDHARTRSLRTPPRAADAAAWPPRSKPPASSPKAGKVAVIANGRLPGVVERVVAGESIGTVFHPHLQTAGSTHEHRRRRHARHRDCALAKAASRVLATLPTASEGRSAGGDCRRA
jgi:glutamate 5-kinase